MILFACVLCAILGRMGGAKGYNTKFRDVGIPTILCIVAYILGVHSWWLVLMFGLMFASLTTYWDFLFGYDNFWFHGFMCGLSFLPIAIVTQQWIGFLIALGITTVWMGGWSKVIKNDVLEELGRYFILPVPLLFLT